MFPRLLDLGAFELFGRTFHPVLHTYGLLLAGGFVVGIADAARRAPRHGIERKDIYDLALHLFLGAIIGAKALLFLVNPEPFLRNPAALVTAGGVFLGGFLGAMAASIRFFRSRGIPVWEGGDLLAPSIALGHGIGRLGCFAGGCCYGLPAEGAPAVTFTDIYANSVTGVPLHTPLHPTQLYEAGFEFALFGLLLWLTPRKKFAGQIFYLWVGLYAVGRFSIEFLRGDPRGFVFDELLSTSQFLSIWLLVGAVIALLILRRRAAA